MSVPYKFTVSYVLWAASGFKVRDPAEVKRILTEVCGPCEEKNGNICNACKCFLKKKAKMATETCPLGKYVAEV